VVITGPPAVAAALDGEVRTLDTPLRFQIRPSVLRARIALDEPGASPALLHPPMSASTIVGLIRVVVGQPVDGVVVAP
jgi:hypothetical protein